MPEITKPKGSTKEEVRLRFVDATSVGPAESIDETTPGLALWYQREGGPKVSFAPAALTSLLSPWVSGGIEPISDGYTRIDVPDAAFDFGTDSVLIGGSATGVIGVAVEVRLTIADVPTTEPVFSGGASQDVDCNVFLPEATNQTPDGCPITTKRRHIPIPKGVCGTAVWTMRLKNGSPANFQDCVADVSVSESDSITLEPSGEIKVRFSGCDRGDILGEVDGNILDAASGLITFPTDTICQNAGIYQFSAALLKNDSPVFIDSGLISVEHSLWGNTANMLGPPTIEEIRMHMRDRPEENTLLGAVEFDDAEILEAIRQPVFEFNECPPQMHRRYNCNNFRWRYNWINAIVGNLLRSAVHHYLRNKMQAAGSSLTVDSKNKDDSYLRFAKMYRDEWQLFIREKKCELNAKQFWGTIN